MPETTFDHKKNEKNENEKSKSIKKWPKFLFIIFYQKMIFKKKSTKMRPKNSQICNQKVTHEQNKRQNSVLSLCCPHFHGFSRLQGWGLRGENI